MHLVDRNVPENVRNEWQNVSRDITHLPSAFRLAFFTAKLLSSSVNNDELGANELETLFYNLPLAIQLIDDDLSIENCNGITGVIEHEQREEYFEVIAQGRAVINGWIHSRSPIEAERGTTISSMLFSFWESNLTKLEGTSPVDYRIGEAFVKIMTEAGSLRGTKSADTLTRISRESRMASAIRSGSWFVVLRHSIVANAAGTRLCNELVADSTGLKSEDGQKDG